MSFLIIELLNLLFSRLTLNYNYYDDGDGDTSIMYTEEMYER